MSHLLCKAGVKKSLVLEPGTSKISFRTSIYFHPMSDEQVKKNTVPGYISLNAQRYLATGQVKIWVYLSAGQVNILRIFYPCKA